MSEVYGVIYLSANGKWKIYDKFWADVAPAVPHIEIVRETIRKERQALKVWDQSIPSAMIVEIEADALSKLLSHVSERTNAGSQSKEEVSSTQEETKGAEASAQ